MAAPPNRPTLPRSFCGVYPLTAIPTKRFEIPTKCFAIALPTKNYELFGQYLVILSLVVKPSCCQNAIFYLGAM